MSSPERFTPWRPPVADAPRVVAAADETAADRWRPAPLSGPRAAAGGGDDSSRAFEAGRAAGEAAATARLESAVRAMRRAASAREEDRDDFEAARTLNLEALALAIARHRVDRAYEADPGLVATLVERAMRLLPDGPPSVRLNPSDLERVRATLAGGDESHAPARLVADAEIAPGNFVIESPQRLVDGRTDVALRRLYERFEHA